MKLALSFMAGAVVAVYLHAPVLQWWGVFMRWLFSRGDS